MQTDSISRKSKADPKQALLCKFNFQKEIRKINFWILRFFTCLQVSPATFPKRFLMESISMFKAEF